jgi:ribosomal protein S21
MRGLLNDADKEIRRISGQRLKTGITATLKAVDDYEHIRAEHKRKAREAWKQLGNK